MNQNVTQEQVNAEMKNAALDYEAAVLRAGNTVNTKIETCISTGSAIPPGGGIGWSDRYNPGKFVFQGKGAWLKSRATNRAKKANVAAAEQAKDDLLVQLEARVSALEATLFEHE